jgi:hypothetical protein
MAAKKPPNYKKYFTIGEANASLPLIRAIVRDIAKLAGDLEKRQELLSQRHGVDELHREELQQLQADFERDKESLRECCRELVDLGVELKDMRVGLIDFPCKMEDREVYLCWRLGEPEVAYWHELDAGFAGRRRLLANAEQR